MVEILVEAGGGFHLRTGRILGVVLEQEERGVHLAGGIGSWAKSLVA